jgi:GDP-mannose 6-dehydrogenase
MKIAVLGLGYVGCVTAACLAEAGNTVIGVDPAPKKVAAINSGMTPIVEPGLAERLANAHASKRISASTDVSVVKEVDVAIVCVGTPSAETGELDLRYVETVATEIGRGLPGRSTPLTIMLRSTVLPGTTALKFIPWIEKASGLIEGRDFFVAFCPEFLRESTAISDFYNPPFTVIGVESPSAAEKPSELLSFLDTPAEVVSTGVAEALKYASNAFHAVKVVFANEIARACAISDVDARTVMQLFVQDRELNISHRYLRPGFAFGGSCLPKDVKALQHYSQSRGLDLPMIDSLTASNDVHIQRVVTMVEASGAKTVAQVGLTFKPSTDDMRESPFVKVAAKLVEMGIEVRAYDPIIDVEKLMGANQSFVEAVLPDLESMLVDDLEEALVGADLVLLGTNAADVCEIVLSGPSVPVVDLSGSLPKRVEDSLRTRGTSSLLAESYVGAAW